MPFSSCFLVCISIVLCNVKYAGVSLKTQELYAIVFATRYLDIFTDYISLYNTVMKVIFLGSSFSIVWYIRHHKIVRRSYDKDQDTFRHYFLVLPCLLLALVINEKFTFKEVSFLLTCIVNVCLNRIFLIGHVNVLKIFPRYVSSDYVDLFHLLRSCCHPSSAGFAAEDS